MKADGVVFFPYKVYFLWPWPLSSFSSLPPSWVLILPHCLELLGSQFHSNSGVEEMIPLLQAWHPPCLVSKMNGVCSFAYLPLNFPELPDPGSQRSPHIQFMGPTVNYSLSWKVGFLRNGVFAAISVKKKKKGHHSHQRLQSPQMVSWWALSKLMKERVSPSSSDQTTLTPHSEPWGNSGCENRIRAPDSWDTFQRNDFSEPRLLHLPTYWKVLNSLTGDTDFL